MYMCVCVHVRRSHIVATSRFPGAQSSLVIDESIPKKHVEIEWERERERDEKRKSVGKLRASSMCIALWLTVTSVHQGAIQCLAYFDTKARFRTGSLHCISTSIYIDVHNVACMYVHGRFQSRVYTPSQKHDHEDRCALVSHDPEPTRVPQVVSFYPLAFVCNLFTRVYRRGLPWEYREDGVRKGSRLIEDLSVHAVVCLLLLCTLSASVQHEAHVYMWETYVSWDFSLFPEQLPAASFEQKDPNPKTLELIFLLVEKKNEDLDFRNIGTEQPSLR